MLKEIAVRALGAIEEVFLLALFAFGGAGVGVWIGDFGRAAVGSHVEGVVQCDHGGEGGGCEDVAGRREREMSVWRRVRKRMMRLRGGSLGLKENGRYPYSLGRVRVRDMVMVELETSLGYIFQSGVWEREVF